jgi:hypothetical protein
VTLKPEYGYCIITPEERRRYLSVSLHYYNSTWWKELRERFLENTSAMCQGCGLMEYEDIPTWEVHHVRYSNLGTDNEWNDLIRLCDCCHATLHYLERDGSGQGNRAAICEEWLQRNEPGLRWVLLQWFPNYSRSYAT